ncbi:MAG: SH3 domain-containing protein [Oscillospiraceae bacterium]|jgi:uncharacterized protein YgiM (DUF1202 family)
MKNSGIRICTVIIIIALLISFSSLGASAAVSGSQAGRVTLGYGNLNIRSAASTSSAVVSKVPNGSYITLISKSGNWWKVEYAEGKYGYCYASYITAVSGTYAAYATGSLNVRSGPGTSYGVVGWLNSGEYAVVLSSSGTWKKVLFNGVQIGYASGAYLTTGSSGYTQVYLSVPSFKQKDSRWANIALGRNGDTIGTSGCSTVALSMTESYRTGTTVYPSEMVYRLGYTSGGAVYWPGYYTAYTGGDYLAKVYSLLKAGKPVLVGSKDSYGGQHWVVVTGFKGGSLSASNFVINDPGTAARTNLQQYFGAYPYFYKLMYY